MSGLSRVSATDVVRSFGARVDAATPESIKSWLEREYLSKQGGGFSYDPAIAGLAETLSGRLSFEAARHRVGEVGRPLGRPYNVAVFDALQDYSAGHAGLIYRLKYVAVKIGSHNDFDVHIGLKVPLVRVHRGVPRLVIPAFRNSFLPTFEQSGLECSIALAFLAQNDFYGVEEFEYLCVRSNRSALDRTCEVLTRRELPLRNLSEVNVLLTNYLKAVSMLVDEGKGTDSQRMAGYRIIDPNAADAADLFS